MELVGWGWAVVVCAFGCRVSGLAVVGRGVRWQVWNGWVGVGQWWMVLGGWSMLTQLKPQDPKNGKTFEAFAIGGSVAQVASLACGVWVVRWWVWVWGW